MNQIACKELVDNYIKWLKEKIKVKSIGEICELTTPFLDRHNDYIQIYVKRTENGFLLTDDGVIIRDLEMSGLEFHTERRKNELQIILNGFGIRLKGDALQVETRPENFAQKKHNLLQAMLSINDLFVLAPAKVVSFFREDVEQFLNLHEVRFTRDIHFIGKSGFNHHFDFVIPPSKQKAERVLRAINNPRKDSISALIFSWTDTRQVREEKAKAIAILNDSENAVSSDIYEALSQYEISAMPWSRRDQFLEDLVN
jgi:hypothetical protein